MSRYILALDQGTTSSRAILFNEKAQIVGIAQREFTQIYPQAGWVEHNPDEIWDTQLATAQQVLTQHGVKPAQIAAIAVLGALNRLDTAGQRDGLHFVAACFEGLHGGVVKPIVF